MKLKYYLRGLGIGIITTVIIMLITFSGSKSSLSNDQIIERAKTLGMVMNDESSNSKNEIPKGTESNTQSNKETTTEKQSIPSSTQQLIPEQTQTNTAKTDNTQSQTEPNIAKDTQANTLPAVPEQNSNQNDPNANTTQTAADTKNQSVSFEIRTGDSSDSVADRLHQAGLIEDAQGFNHYLIEKGYDKKLRVGTYTIDKSSTNDYQKILDNIMK